MTAKRTMTPKNTKVLIILDGWGYSADSQSNAITAADTPVWDAMLAKYPHTLVGTSGTDVGLPEGQMGNSEVGHMNIGAGRIVHQNLTRISRSISTQEFFSNQSLVHAMDEAISRGGKVHISGLLSDGGVHSHIEHIEAALRLAKQRGAASIVFHAWLDGRDVAPRSAEQYIRQITQVLKEVGGHFGSLCGRYYSMDRDQRWERIQRAYNAMVMAQAEYQYNDPIDALNAAYVRGESDEFVKPCVLVNNTGIGFTLDSEDAFICMNFRPDRSRQIMQALADLEFTQFNITSSFTNTVMLTEYGQALRPWCACAFLPETITHDLGDVMCQHGMTQLRIAETEKYAHVTFFFSGGKESLYAGEERELIASPNVATYDLQPQMSAFEVTDKLLQAIQNRCYDLIVCNFANADMVGHTGKFNAAIKAVEALDACLGRIIEALLQTGGEALITADHGNVELMVNPDTGQPHTAHTAWPVPLIYVTQKPDASRLKCGVLADIAPTILSTMGIPIPQAMTGASLIESV